MKIVRYAVIGLLLLACGCIKLDHTLTLTKDGSGTVDINISLQQKSALQLSAMLKLKDELDKANKTDSASTNKKNICKAILEGSQDDISNAFKPYEKFGITLEKKRLEGGDNIRSIYLKLSFADISKAAKSDLFEMYGFSINKNEGGNYVITRPSNEGDKKRPPITSQARDQRNTRAILEGFEVVLRVRTPGVILKTNAQLKSKYTAVWSFDVTVDENALYNLQSQNYGIVFDGRNVSIPEIKYTTPALPGKP